MVTNKYLRYVDTKIFFEPTKNSLNTRVSAYIHRSAIEELYRQIKSQLDESKWENLTKKVDEFVEVCIKANKLIYMVDTSREIARVYMIINKHRYQSKKYEYFINAASGLATAKSTMHEFIESMITIGNDIHEEMFKGGLSQQNQMSLNNAISAIVSNYIDIINEWYDIYEFTSQFERLSEHRTIANSKKLKKGIKRFNAVYADIILAHEYMVQVKDPIVNDEPVDENPDMEED